MSRSIGGMALSSITAEADSELAFVDMRFLQPQRAHFSMERRRPWRTMRRVPCWRWGASRGERVDTRMGRNRGAGGAFNVRPRRHALRVWRLVLAPLVSKHICERGQDKSYQRQNRETDKDGERYPCCLRLLQPNVQQQLGEDATTSCYKA